MTLAELLSRLLPASLRSGDGIPPASQDRTGDERRAQERLYPRDVAKNAWAERAIVNPYRKDPRD